MRIHVIQHVPFEGPGLIGEWAAERGHSLDVTLAITERYPRPDDVDLLVVMGGPMAADDEVASPWLAAEKRFIAETISIGQLVLGVCLGAQIIAEVIGGRVRRASHKEIGWFPVHLTEAGESEPLLSGWPEHAVVGHWHGDTFDLPLGPAPVLSSEATPNQAYVFDDRVVGLQFHLEWDEATLAALLAECSSDLGDGGAYVMSAQEFADEIPDRIPPCRDLLFALLDEMAALGPRRHEAVAE